MVNMEIEVAKEYFSKLLNTSLEIDTVIKLSSGQAARAYTWLKDNNYYVDLINLSEGFKIQQLNSGKESELFTKKQKIPDGNHTNINFIENNFIGVDIQYISELFPNGMPLDPKTDKELLGIFTIRELSYAQSKSNSMQTLTGMFAAKEAIIKCSYNKKNLSEIEILPKYKGKPYIDGFSISISHSHDYAVAVAINNHIFQIYQYRNIEKKIENISSFVPYKLGTEAEYKFFNYILLIILLILIIFELNKLL